MPRNIGGAAPVRRLWRVEPLHRSFPLRVYRRCSYTVLPRAAVLFLVACAACSSPEQDRTPEEISNSYPVAPIPVASSILFESDHLALPSRVAVIHDYLVVTDPYTAPHIHVIEKNTGRLVRSFGRTGEGPGEYRSPLAVVADESSNRAWIGDSPLGRITGILLDSIRSENWQPYTEIIRLHDKTFGDILLSAPAGTSGPRLLATDLSGQAQFFEFDAHGQILGQFGPPVPQSGTIPPEIAGRVFGTVTALVRHDSLVAAGGLWTGTIVLYDREGYVRDSVHTPIRFSPAWAASGTPEKPGMRATAETRKGYVQLAERNGQILGLFSGLRLQEYPTDVSGGRDLHVFDREGKLIRVYRFDRSLTSIAVDTESHTLYGTHWGTRPAVLKIELPDR